MPTEKKTKSELDNLVDDLETDESIPDEQEIVALAKRGRISESEDELKALASQNSKVITAEFSKEYGIIILNQNYGVFKYRIAITEEPSIEIKRRISRMVRTYSIAVLTFVSIEPLLFQKLYQEAYGKKNLAVREKQKRTANTRETISWRIQDVNESDVDSDEQSVNPRHDISDLSSYYPMLAEMQSGVFDFDSIVESSDATRPLVHFILKDAVLAGASDIHFQPKRGGGRIRYRVDGKPYTRFDSIPTKAYERIVNSLCTMADKTPAQMRKQIVESRIKLLINLDEEIKPVEFRFQSLTTIHNNPAVILRSQTKPFRDINKLGFEDEQLVDIKDSIQQDRGIVVVTGPTGSGKTNTLNCLFAELEKDDDKIIYEIGSPIEIESPYRVQINIQEKPDEKSTDIIYQMNFKGSMRADPDVIGFTEVRNPDESKIAFRAANTGHLVLTTLHAADIHETFVRLFEMDIARSIISKGILCIVAQTLIRTLCGFCKIEDREATEMAGTSIYLENEDGCRKCDKGIGGRTAVSEVIRFDDDVIRWIDEGLSPREITEQAIEQNKFIPMKRVAKRKIIKGIASESEVVSLVELKTELNADSEMTPNIANFEYDAEIEDQISNINEKLKEGGVQV